jgi:DNA-binding HxlR family transcriptional regulator
VIKFENANIHTNLHFASFNDIYLQNHFNMMKKKTIENIDKRSPCPISRTLELVGDKWSLLIIRDMMYANKSTYNEFLDSPEGIATNILNDRLKKLTEMGILTFTGVEKRKKYILTELGHDLKPIVEAIGTFGMKHFEGSKEYVEKQLKAAARKNKNPV